MSATDWITRCRTSPLPGKRASQLRAHRGSAEPASASPRTQTRWLRSTVAPVGDVAGDELGALLTPLGLGVELLDGELAKRPDNRAVRLAFGHRHR